MVSKLSTGLSFGLLALFLGSVIAGNQPPVLNFAHIAAGGPIVMEIILANSGTESESGAILFFDDSGNPLELTLGDTTANRFQFTLQPQGSIRLASVPGGEIRSGYASVLSDAADSQLSGSIIFGLAGSEVSIPATLPVQSQQNFVEFGDEVDTGAAFANLGSQPATLQLALLTTEGAPMLTSTLDLGPGQKQASFVSQLFPALAGDFEGTLHARSDQPFHMLGLRQKRNGVLASLAGGPSGYQRAQFGSQLLFAIDSGIDVTTGNFSESLLSQLTVHELTGAEAAARSSRIVIRNHHPQSAVTVHIHFFSATSCDNLLDFLVVIPCNDELVFDPFDFDIPGFNGSTRNLLLGAGDLSGILGLFPNLPLRGDGFRTGKFVLSVTAVGVSTDSDNVPDLRFPNEIAPIGQCDVTPLNTGSRPGLSPDHNLTVCNARPMSFDFLEGFQTALDDASCQGPVEFDNNSLRDASAFTRMLVQTPLCLVPNAPPLCTLFGGIDDLGATGCNGQPIQGTVAVDFKGPTFQIQP